MNFVIAFLRGEGDLDIVKRALAEGKDINPVDEDGWTVLIHACYWRWGEVKHVLFCLENGADIHQANEDGDTPLHYASHDGKTDICQLLLERGADVNHAGYRGYTPLHFAAKNGYLGICKLLMKHGADQTLKSRDGETALDIAREEDEHIIVAFFYRIPVMVYVLHARSITQTSGRRHPWAVLPVDLLRRVFEVLPERPC